VFTFDKALTKSAHVSPINSGVNSENEEDFEEGKTSPENNETKTLL